MTIQNRMFSNAVSSIAFFCLMSVSAPLFAAESENSSAWVFGADVYLWGAQVDATTAAGKEGDIPFSTLIDDLEMAFMGGLGARNDKWTVRADAIYLDVKDGASGGGGLNVSGDVELKGWIVTPTVGYAVHNSEQARVEVIAGARYLWLDSGVTVNANGRQSFNTSDSGSNWDGVVGMRAEINVAPKWYLPVYVDVGTGDSKSTWQALAGVGYRFSKIDAVLAYRYLDYDFDDSSVFDGLTFKGPLAGISFRF